jgi:hypothetical protein
MEQEKSLLLSKLVELLEEHRKLRESDAKNDKKKKRSQKLQVEKEQIEEDEASEFISKLGDDAIKKARKSYTTKAKKRAEGDDSDIINKLNEKLQKKEAFLKPPSKKQSSAKKEVIKPDEDEDQMSKSEAVKMEIIEHIEAEKEAKEPVRQTQAKIEDAKTEIEKTLEVATKAFAPEIETLRTNNIKSFLGSYRNKNRFL